MSEPIASSFLSTADFGSPTVVLPKGLPMNINLDHPYLRTRGVTAETARQFGVGSGWSPDVLPDRLLFPIHDAGGRFLGYQGRWPADPVPPDQPKWLTTGAVIGQPFNVHRAGPRGSAEPVRVVVGFFPVLHLWQLGVRRVIGLPDMEVPDRVLAGLREHFLGGRFVLLTDATEAGRWQRLRLLDRFGRFASVEAPVLRQPGQTLRSLTSAV